MAPKRKSDAMESAPLAEASSSGSAENLSQIALDHPNKKTRVSDASKVASTSEADKGTLESTKPTKPQSWRDIKLDGEDKGEVLIFDDPGDVRRKIKLLQKTPGWKVTHWLQEIGINSNSYGRFMREKGKIDGVHNGTYYAAYVYFEKMRIFENKKKTPKRRELEKKYMSDPSRENDRSTWVWNR